jgi:hypothetical protein
MLTVFREGFVDGGCVRKLSNLRKFLRYDVVDGWMMVVVVSCSVAVGEAGLHAIMDICSTVPIPYGK